MAKAFHFSTNHVSNIIVSQAIHDAEAVLAHAQKKAEASKEALAQVQLLATWTVFFFGGGGVSQLYIFHLQFSSAVIDYKKSLISSRDKRRQNKWALVRFVEHLMWEQCLKWYFWLEMPWWYLKQTKWLVQQQLLIIHLMLNILQAKLKLREQNKTEESSTGEGQNYCYLPHGWLAIIIIIIICLCFIMGTFL